MELLKIVDLGQHVQREDYVGNRLELSLMLELAQNSG